MNFNRLLNTPVGQAFISFILGIGIATLFRTVCKDGDCITFDGPILSEIDENKIFKHNDICYKYKQHSTSCMANKKTISIKSTEQQKKDKANTLTKTPSPMSILENK
jgi:hypothetical protein